MHKQFGQYSCARTKNRRSEVERPYFLDLKPLTSRASLRRSIRSFHALNYSLHIPRLFPFYDPEFTATRRAGRDKVQFFVRRQHQVVALTAPGHVIAKPASIGSFALFPLDWDIFIESGHHCLRGCILSELLIESKESVRSPPQRITRATWNGFQLVHPPSGKRLSRSFRIHL